MKLPDLSDPLAILLAKYIVPPTQLLLVLFRKGVQHPFEFQTLSNPELTNAILTAVTYQKFTKDFITLKIRDNAMYNLRYTLFFANGSSIVSKAITASSTQIQMKYLSIGAYVLKVSQKNKSLKTFKILKQQ